MTIITNDLRALMNQRETDSPTIKAIKWDFWSMHRMSGAYRDICEEEQVDLTALMLSLANLVSFAYSQGV